MRKNDRKILFHVVISGTRGHSPHFTYLNSLFLYITIMFLSNHAIFLKKIDFVYKIYKTSCFLWHLKKRPTQPPHRRRDHSAATWPGSASACPRRPVSVVSGLCARASSAALSCPAGGASKPRQSALVFIVSSTKHARRCSGHNAAAVSPSRACQGWRGNATGKGLARARCRPVRWCPWVNVTSKVSHCLTEIPYPRGNVFVWRRCLRRSYLKHGDPG